MYKQHSCMVGYSVNNAVTMWQPLCMSSCMHGCSSGEPEPLTSRRSIHTSLQLKFYTLPSCTKIRTLEGFYSVFYNTNTVRRHYFAVLGPSQDVLFDIGYPTISVAHWPDSHLKVRCGIESRHSSLLHSNPFGAKLAGVSLRGGGLAL